MQEKSVNIYMKALYYLLSLIFLLSCSPKKQNPPVPNNPIITSGQLEVILGSYNINGYDEIIDDSQYQLVTKDWVVNYFYPLCKEELINKNLSFNENSWDCDDFAVFAKNFAQQLNNLTKNKGKCAVAVGKINFVKDLVGSHSINVIVIEEDNKIEILFLEPQSGEIMILSKKEIESIFTVEF